MNNIIISTVIAIITAAITIGFVTALKADRETETSTGRFRIISTFQFKDGYSDSGHIYQDIKTGVCVLTRNGPRRSAMTQWPCPK